MYQILIAKKTMKFCKSRGAAGSSSLESRQQKKKEKESDAKRRHRVVRIPCKKKITPTNQVDLDATVNVNLKQLLAD